MSDYPAFHKIPRWYRDITITEKIDGTNGLISIQYNSITSMGTTGTEVIVRAGSRNRWITPEADNHGFAKWVYANSSALAETLGEGMHYGEWWGAGIQRRYGLTGNDKRFSLFNAHRWKDLDGTQVPGLHVVPTLWVGRLRENVIDNFLDVLEEQGSYASPGFRMPEGIVIYHSASRQYFKATLENDSEPKGKVDDRAA